MPKVHKNLDPFYMSRGECALTERIMNDIVSKKIVVGLTFPANFVHRYAAARLRDLMHDANETTDEGEMYRLRVEGRKTGLLHRLGIFTKAGISYYEPLVESGEIAEQQAPAIRDSEDLNILRGLHLAIHDHEVAEHINQAETFLRGSSE